MPHHNIAQAAQLARDLETFSRGAREVGGFMAPSTRGSANTDVEFCLVED